MKKASDERPRRQFSGYPKRTAPREVKDSAISSEALLVAAILLSATLLLVTFLAPAGKKILSPDQGIGTFPKRGHGN
jgi:hypothetical protein